MLHPALSRAVATAQIEDLLRDAAQRHTIRLARVVEHDPHLAGASDVPTLTDGCGPAVATAGLAVTDFRCIER
jgi:hypothetical protein